MFTIKMQDGTILTTSKTNLPWEGKVKQIEDGSVEKFDDGEELVSFYVECNSSSMEPGRQYHVLGAQKGKLVNNTSYLTIN